MSNIKRFMEKTMKKNDLMVLKALADESRIKILDMLMKDELYVEAISEMLDLKPSTVSHHLKKLMAVGLVFSRKDQYYTLFSVNKDLLNRSLLSFISTEAEEVEKHKRKLEDYNEKVIKSFFKYGKLLSIPVQHKKRLIVLKEIVKSFEYGVVYEESQVNDIIKAFHEDFCTIRREMIASHLMKRENNLYWREI